MRGRFDPAGLGTIRTWGLDWLDFDATPPLIGLVRVVGRVSLRHLGVNLVSPEAQFRQKLLTAFRVVGLGGQVVGFAQVVCQVVEFDGSCLEEFDQFVSIALNRA